VLDAFRRHPGRRWLVAPTVFVDEHGAELAVLRPPRFLSAARYRTLGWSCLPQPSTFLRTELMRELGGFDTSYRLAGDYDLFARALDRTAPLHLSRPLSRFLLHRESLTSTRTREMRAESQRIERQSHMPFPRHMLLKLLTKVQVNASNPGWAWGKLRGRIH
jgi:hypothetical protein